MPDERDDEELPVQEDDIVHCLKNELEYHKAWSIAQSFVLLLILVFTFLRALKM